MVDVDNGVCTVNIDVGQCYFGTRRNSCGRTRTIHMTRVAADKVNHVAMYCMCSFRITTLSRTRVRSIA